MATGTDEKWVIDKLDGPNWTTWKFQMKHLLLAKGLWGVVDGTEVLADDAAEGVRTEFQKKSQKAFSTLVLAITASQLYLVTSCEQARDAWVALRNHFERDTLANKLFLKKQYFRTEMKEGTSAEKHLKYMKELTDRLAAIGAPIDEEDQVVTLLGSLPKSYSTLVTALEARSDDISLNYVQQALVHEEQKLHGLSYSSSPDVHRGDTALVGDSKMSSKKTFKYRKPLICFGCRQPGHFLRDCPKSKKGTAHKARTAGEEVQEQNLDRVTAYTASKDLSQTDVWLVDSGASSHMTWNKELLTDYKMFEKPEKVGLGDGHTVDAFGTGNVHLNMLFKQNHPKKSIMYKVLHVPQLTCNLFSVRAASSKGNVLKFGHSRCWIHDSSGQLTGMGTMVDKLYQLDCEALCSEQATYATSQTDDITDVWHYRLGHANEQCIKSMANKKLATGIRLPKCAKLSFCEACIAGKMKRQPFRSVGEIRSKRKLQLIHSDVCGPMPTESIGGNAYFVTFIDDFSRCCAVYFLKRKSEVFSKFKEFEQRVHNDCDLHIGTLRSDNGGEYLSNEFKIYLKSKGIHHELTVPHCPEQNGVAERMNRTLMEMARSMMAHAGLPDKYWAEAVEAAAYIRNRTSTSSIKGFKTPYEVWSGKKPDIGNLKVFGCMAYSHVHDSQRQKLDKKAVKLRFVGYCIQSKGYRLLDEKTSRVFIRRDVIFNEQNFGHKSEVLKQDSPETFEADPKVEIEPVMEQEQDTEPEQLRRSERSRQPPVRYGIDEYATPSVQHVALKAYQITEPQSMEEALTSDLSSEWKQAADSEYKSLMDNQTWDLVELPNGREPIGSKWVFKVKPSSDGKVERFKARLVAKGYAQKYGIDYDETFSPVVKFSSVRALIAFAVQNNMLLHQMDVVTAFLNGNLEEDIYMQQPDGYVQEDNKHLVCKLKKSLYGLKQSPRCWNKAFTEFMRSKEFKQSEADPCIYIRGTSIVAVYVDDLIIATKTEGEMQLVKEVLHSRFKMKDMGKLHYCLGITIRQDDTEKKIEIQQKQYILRMLEKYGLQDAKPVSTPADPNVRLRKDDGVSKTVDPVLYQSMVGSLLYAAIATRPDISQAVGTVSKFSSKPSEAHLTAVKRIFRYLKDYAGDLDDRHSTSGNLFLMCGGAVNWLSKKQPIVTLSTAEAEYVALSTATQEAVWLRKLLKDFGEAQDQATMVMEDNQGAICIAKNPGLQNIQGQNILISATTILERL